MQDQNIFVVFSEMCRNRLKNKKVHEKAYNPVSSLHNWVNAKRKKKKDVLRGWAAGCVGVALWRFPVAVLGFPLLMWQMWHISIAVLLRALASIEKRNDQWQHCSPGEAGGAGWGTATRTGQSYQEQDTFKSYHSKNETTCVPGSNNDTGEIWSGISLWAVLSSAVVPKQSPAQDSRGRGGAAPSPIPDPRTAARPSPALPRRSGRSCARLRCCSWHGAEPRVGHTHGFGLLALQLEWLFNFCHPRYLMRTFTVCALCGKVL